VPNGLKPTELDPVTDTGLLLMRGPHRPAEATLEALPSCFLNSAEKPLFVCPKAFLASPDLCA